MIPGETFPVAGTLTLNESNPALEFDRDVARGMRLDIAAGTAVRFEPGLRREVQLIPFGGHRRIIGFNAQIMGDL